MIITCVNTCIFRANLLWWYCRILVVVSICASAMSLFENRRLKRTFRIREGWVAYKYKWITENICEKLIWSRVSCAWHTTLGGLIQFGMISTCLAMAVHQMISALVHFYPAIHHTFFKIQFICLIFLLFLQNAPVSYNANGLTPAQFGGKTRKKLK